MKKVSIISSLVLAVIVVAGILTFNACQKDPCKDVTCLNDGTCVDGTCQCTTGYEGTDCSIEMRTKFIASYAIVNPWSIDSCSASTSSGTANFNSTISTSTSSVDAVLISNFAGYGVSVSATVSGSTITIPSQVVSGTTFSGSGPINSSETTINISYTAVQGCETETGNMACTKQ